jgi:hypothetical protein
MKLDRVEPWPRRPDYDAEDDFAPDVVERMKALGYL